MKKIYFGCSIAGGRDYAHLHQDIVSMIKASGAQVLSELFADKVLRAEVGMKLDPAVVWQRDVNWVQEADSLIMEVTQPSLGVGYELGMAENAGKPVLALFYTPSGRRLSPMVSGNPAIKVIEYTKVAELKKPIADFIVALDN